MEKLFPCILIFIMLVSCIIYGVKKDYWMALYWLSGALINIAVIFKR
jgi:hypothetical protein